MCYFARCINVIFNSLLTQLVKYDVHTTRKIKIIHAIIYHILLLLLLLLLLLSCDDDDDDDDDDNDDDRVFVCVFLAGV